jgi:predicted AAA+ superfamily ATPase
LLGEAYLLGTVRKFSQCAVRRRSSPPKLITLNNAFLASAMQEDPPAPATDPQQWGRWVENACLAYMVNSGQTVHYWREAPLEVDAIVQGTWGKWAIEVKTGTYAQRDLAGLLEFVRRFPEHRPLLVCDETRTAAAERLGVDAMPWREFLWSGVQEVS